MAIAHHVSIRLASSEVLAPGQAERLAAVRAICRATRPFELLDFAVVDTHSHFLVGEGRPASAELARRVQLSLHRTLGLGVSFERARVRPVLDQRHLDNAFFYVLRQHEHHGLAGASNHEATNLPDLLGLRVGGGWTRRHVARRLPRVGDERLLEVLGWDGHVPGDLMERVDDLQVLGAAAAAAAGYPVLRGSRPVVVAARRAAIQLGLEGASPVDVGRALGVDPKTVWRHRRQDVDPALFEAIRRQVAWRRGWARAEVDRWGATSRVR